MKSGSCMTLLSVPDIDCCHRKLCFTAQDHHYPMQYYTLYLVAHYKLLPMGQIITGPVFATVGTCQQTLKQELALVKRKDVLYCYANTRPCVAQVTRNTIQLWDTVLSTLLPWTLLPLPFPWQPPSWEIRHNWCRLSTSTHRLFCGQDTWFLPPCSWRHIHKRF